MKFLGFFIFIFISTEIRGITATRVGRQLNRTARMDPFWKTNHGALQGYTSRLPYRKSFNYNNLNSTSVRNSTYGRQALQRIPQINFYSSIPNALGVIGQGIIWLREISAALGTPLPIWIFTIPFFILGVGLMFMPDLTQLHLPLFYPDGAGDGDPLAAFPPLPDLDAIPGINMLKQATQFIPSKFILEKIG